VAELVDALVSGTSGAIRGGSSPLLGTNNFFIINKIITVGLQDLRLLRNDLAVLFKIDRRAIYPRGVASRLSGTNKRLARGSCKPNGFWAFHCFHGTFSSSTGTGPELSYNSQLSASGWYRFTKLEVKYTTAVWEKLPRKGRFAGTVWAAYNYAFWKTSPANRHTKIVGYWAMAGCPQINYSKVSQLTSISAK
jgi:hypothetical protein